MRFGDGERAVNVLFVCHDNAMLGLMAESVARSIGGRRLTAASAGVGPAAEPNPLVIDFLKQRHMPVDGLHPKSVREACAGQRFDFIIALCAGAAEALASSEQQVLASWNLEELVEQLKDPRTAPQAVRDAFWVLMRRIKIFANLPHHLPRRTIQHRLEDIPGWS